MMMMKRFINKETNKTVGRDSDERDRELIVPSSSLPSPFLYILVFVYM